MTAAQYLAERHALRLAELQSECRATAKDDSYVGGAELAKQVEEMPKLVIPIRSSVGGVK